MKKNIYEELAQAFDSLSFGLPKAAFHVERALLKKFFNEDDARYFCDMTPNVYETCAAYAERNGISEDEASRRLEQLASKGLVFRRRRETGCEYKMYPIMFGLIEFQTHKADTSWKLPLGLYMAMSPFGKQMSATMPFYRSVPFEKEFVEGSQVLPYDDIRAVLDKHELFTVMPCLCRMMFQSKPGNKCHHPLETCIMTDDYAQFLIDNGWGRQITREEALEIIMEGKDDGRVINITNSQDGENICSCCACGCGMLYLKTKYPGPSADYWSNYYCVSDAEKCVGCGACAQHCPFKAITVDGKAKIDASRCLGCGICNYKCALGALSLRRKDDDKLYTPPETYDEAIEIWGNITPRGKEEHK